MGKNTRKEYLKAIRGRYGKAGRKEKKQILDEFCKVCGYNRKYAVRLLNGKPKPPAKRPGPKPIYAGGALLKPLKRIWLTTDQVCSKRLVRMIPVWLPHYQKQYGAIDSDTMEKLLAVSPATIDRLLKPVRFQFKLKGISGTKPGTLLKNMIPIKPYDMDITRPGMIEADTVAHCGNSIAGDFVWSITFTDVYSGWTENRATWNKGAHGVLTQVEDVEKTLPFPIENFSCDNGGEFLNYHLYRYFNGRKKPVNFTRTRPYKKNDNARVEQKNWTHVRQLLGYDRFDKPEMVPLINDLYKTWSLYQNYFFPTFKLIEKTRVNSKIKKKYEKPKTPYQRLLESPDINDETKAELRAVYSSLNPFQLKNTVEKKLKKIFNVLSYLSYESTIKNT